MSEPLRGTGEVVIGAASRPPTEKWMADWIDSRGNVKSGPQAASLDECLSWALKDATPARIVIWTQNRPDGDPQDWDAKGGIPSDQFGADPTYHPGTE